MHSKTFFRVALLLPLAVPLLALFYGDGRIAAILTISLWAVGVEYVLFSVFSFIYIGRLESLERVKRYLWLAPVCFSPVSVIGWYVRAFWERRSNPDLVVSLDAIPLLVVFGLVVGYGYCVMTALIFEGVKKCGLISLESKWDELGSDIEIIR